MPPQDAAKGKDRVAFPETPSPRRGGGHGPNRTERGQAGLAYGAFLPVISAITAARDRRRIEPGRHRSGGPETAFPDLFTSSSGVPTGPRRPISEKTGMVTKGRAAA